MAVLCDIVQMSQNPKYAYTCVKSKDKIAEWLDLSRATVFNILTTLETKGFIEKTEIGIKPTQFIINLNEAQEEIGIYIKSNDLELVSAKVRQVLDGQSKNYTMTVQNLDGGRSKIYTQEEQLRSIKETHISPQPEKPKREPKKFIPPTEQEWAEFFIEKGLNDKTVMRNAYDHYALAGWKDSHGKQVVNWKQKVLTNWINKELEKQKKNTTPLFRYHNGKRI